ncbi:unnamed protein product [Cercopithifilaria johnstoni]|uniref:P2X purinoreceptor 7 intracellular domain-containing protein n=1 Tax=Cercopithifilaria johnstoni TaxID=2874296 RepID=A0A8J2MU57_9BILA|nr:unnamed protein product [Cercopithifilaria johnstoni]
MEEARIARKRAHYQLRRASASMITNNTEFFYRMAFSDVEKRINERYAFCCREAENVVNGNCAHAGRLTRKMGNLKCITEHVSFGSICLDKEVLNMLAGHRGVCPRWMGNILTFTNREYRYLAYRSFSYWVHGSESKGNRMDPPLCVLNKIAERYPFDDKISTGYPVLFLLFGPYFFEEYEEGDDMWNYIDLQYSR